LLQLAYPNVGNVPVFRYNDFRQVLPNNPCLLSNRDDASAMASGQ
jgi:hypothetical protein